MLFHILCRTVRGQGTRHFVAGTLHPLVRLGMFPVQAADLRKENTDSPAMFTFHLLFELTIYKGKNSNYPLICLMDHFAEYPNVNIGQ